MVKGDTSLILKSVENGLWREKCQEYHGQAVQLELGVGLAGTFENT